MKRITILAVATAMVFGQQITHGAVILNGAAPTNATSTYTAYPSTSPLKLSDAADYFGLGNYTRGDATVNAVRPTGSAFGSGLTLLTANPPASPTVNNSNFRQIGSGSTFGAYFQRPNGTLYNGGASNQAQAFSTTPIDGVSLTYLLAANTTKTLNYYIASYNAKFAYNLSTDGQTLAEVTTPTGMTGGDDTSLTPGSLHNTGVLSFVLSNTSATASTVTFKLLYGGPYTAGALSASLGIQAATAVPEPAMFGLAGVGCVAMLKRRRR